METMSYDIEVLQSLEESTLKTIKFDGAVYWVIETGTQAGPGVCLLKFEYDSHPIPLFSDIIHYPESGENPIPDLVAKLIGDEYRKRGFTKEQIDRIEKKQAKSGFQFPPLITRETMEKRGDEVESFLKEELKKRWW